jgi:NTP pyrophosphatase (non-canonical NTP hydrolase)
VDIKEIMESLIAFRNDRDWEKFHSSKDLAIALHIESAELLELFLWKTDEEVEMENIKNELADVLCFAFLLAEKLKFDIKEIIMSKIEINKIKYPIEKAKGNAKKYDQL